MGLRLGETLALDDPMDGGGRAKHGARAEVGDIDAARKQVHIRRGKGHKDRLVLVPLPDLTYQALRALWARHRKPRLLFPSAVGTPERIRHAITHMDGGCRQTMRN
jgi:integrase/recombinase XerD